MFCVGQIWGLQFCQSCAKSTYSYFWIPRGWGKSFKQPNLGYLYLSQEKCMAEGWGWGPPKKWESPRTQASNKKRKSKLTFARWREEATSWARIVGSFAPWHPPPQPVYEGRKGGCKPAPSGWMRMWVDMGRGIRRNVGENLRLPKWRLWLTSWTEHADFWH